MTVPELAAERSRLRHEIAKDRKAGAARASGTRGGRLAAARRPSRPASRAATRRPNTGNGFYGKYQFTQSTWAAVGGSGNPAAAPEAEQDRRAAMLLARAGSGQWPVCGR